MLKRRENFYFLTTRICISLLSIFRLFEILSSWLFLNFSLKISRETASDATSMIDRERGFFFNNSSSPPFSSNYPSKHHSQYSHEKFFEISTLIYASIYKYCIQHSCPKFATSQNSYYNDVVYLFFKNLKMEEKEKVDRIGVQRLYCHNWSGRKVSISTVVNNDPPFDAGCPCDSSYFVILLP